MNPNCWIPEDGISFESWEQARRSSNVRYCVGVDLGQRRDFSAIAVIEVSTRGQGQQEYVVKYFKRLKLGLLYADVATRIARLDEGLRLQSPGSSITLILDSTGVGEGVSEMISAALPKADIRKCYITGGITPSKEGRIIKLPKTQLVSTLVALFDSGRIQLPKRSKEIEAMVEELKNYEIHVSEEGRDSYGAFKVGQHDDLVTALGLACWYAERYPPVQFWR